MEFIKPGINIDFVGKRGYAFALSAILIIAGVVSLILHGGPNYGIDFAGGTLVQVKFQKGVKIEELRKVVGGLGLGEVLIQTFGSKDEFLIRLERSSGELKGLSSMIEEGLRKAFGEGSFEIRRVEMVGPKVGRDLRQKGIKAIIFALIGILIYVSWRFEFRFAVGAVIALAHDVMITLGVFSLLDREISLPVLAAFLTIVGYSLNDTIVVYDRIRENMRKGGNEPFSKVINRSINETLSRTILTSLTTLIVVVVLFILGGGVIHNFALALLVGIIVGTYSSIYVASPVVLHWEREGDRRKKKRA